MFCDKVSFHVIYPAEYGSTNRALCVPFMHIVVQIKRIAISKRLPTNLALVNVCNISSG